MSDSYNANPFSGGREEAEAARVAREGIPPSAIPPAPAGTTKPIDFTRAAIDAARAPAPIEGDGYTDFNRLATEAARQYEAGRAANLEAFSYMSPVSDAEYSIIRNRLTDVSDSGGDVLGEAYKMATAVEMSRFFGRSIENVMTNFDANVKAWTGTDFSPTKTNFLAIMDSFKVGSLNVELGKTAREWMEGGGVNPELEKKLDDLTAQISKLQDRTPRPWIINALKTGAESAPFTLRAAGAGALGAGAVALVAGSGGSLAPAAMAALKAGASTIGSFIESADTMRGLEYYEMRKAGIAHDTAQASANVSGALQGAVESLLGNVAGIGRIAGAATGISAKVASRLAVSGKIGTLARSAMQYGGEAIEEGVEEAIQQVISDTIQNVAKESYGLEVKDASTIAKGAWESAKGGFMASLVMGLPSSALGGMKDAKAAKGLREAASTVDREGFAKIAASSVALAEVPEAKRREVSDAIWESVQKKAQAEEKKAEAAPEAERTPIGRTEAGTLWTEETAIPTAEEGKQEAVFKVGDQKTKELRGFIRFEMSEDGITITASKFDKGYGYLREEAIQELAAKYPGVAINVSSTADEKTARAVGNVAAMNPKGSGAQWFETGSDEVAKARARVRLAIADKMPNVKPVQREAAILLHEFRANAMGIAFDEYVESEFQPGIITGDSGKVSAAQGKRAGIAFEKGGQFLNIGQFVKDAKALIYVTEKSDFVSFVHESGHLFRKQLIGTDLGTQLETAYDVVGGTWTREHEERFADDLTKYLSYGEVKDERLRSVFQKIAQWLTSLWDTVLSKQADVDPRVRQVMDQLFASERSPLKEASKEPVAKAEPAETAGPDQYEEVRAALEEKEDEGLYQTEPGRQVASVVFKFPSDLVGYSDIHSQSQITGVLTSFGRGVVGRNGEVRIGAIGQSHIGLATGLHDAKRFYFGYSREKQAVYVVAKNGMDDSLIRSPKVLQMILSNVFDKYKLSTGGKRLQFAETDDNVLFQESPPTDSPAFKKWFGDSKVVDNNGNPLVVYHGTNTAFEAFDIKKAGQTDSGWYGRGFYFTPNANWSFAEDAAENRGGNPSVLPVYIKIEKPMYVQAYAEQGNDMVSVAKNRGFDGVIVKYDSGHEKEGQIAEIVVFSPEQIKSVFNRGTFDPNDPRILYQLEDDFATLRNEWTEQGVALDIYPNARTKSASVTLKVDKSKRGQGLATRAMESAVRLADKHGIRLELTPTDEWGSSKSRLVAFYKRFGFVENKGKNKDFAVSEAMYREPETVLFQLDDEAIDAEAAEYASWEDWKSYVEEFAIPAFGEGGRAPEGLTTEAADAWYKTRWEAARAKVEGKAAAARTAERREARRGEFAVRMAQKGGVESLLSAIWEAEVRAFDRSGAMDEEEQAQVESAQAWRDELATRLGSHSLVLLAAQSVGQGKKIRPSTRKAILSYIRNNETAFKSLYADLTQDVDLAFDVEQELSAIEHIPTPKLGRKAMSVAELTSILNKVNDPKIRARIKSGAITDLEIKDYIRRLEEDKARLGKEAAAAGVQIGELKTELESEKDFAARMAQKAKTVESTKAAEIKAAVKANSSEIRALAKIRARRDMLRRQIMKPAADSIAYRERTIINAIREYLKAKKWERDPDTKKKTGDVVEPDTSAMKANLSQLMRKNPELLPFITEELVSKINDKPLTAWSNAELESLNKTVSGLRTLGRLEGQKRKAMLGAQNSALRTQGAEAVRATKKYQDPGAAGSKEEKDILKSLGGWASRNVPFISTPRLLKMMDGGQEGIHYQTLRTEELQHRRSEAIEVERRMKPYLSYIKANKVKAKDLSKRETIAGIGPGGTDVSWTHDDLISVCLQMKNEDGRAAIIYGNLFSDAERRRYGPKGDNTLEERGAEKAATLDKAIEGLLTESDKGIAEIIAADFGDDGNYDRMNSTMVEATGFDMGPKVSNYFAMYREGGYLEKFGDKGMEALISPEIGMTNLPESGMTIARVKIAPENQMPIRLGAVSIWTDAVSRQEHLVAYLPYMKKINAVYKSRQAAGLREDIKHAFGKEGLDAIDSYISTVAAPDALSKPQPGDNLIRALRGNMSVGMLAFRYPTVMKQILTSVWATAPYAPGHITGAALDLALHAPHPLKWLADIESKSILLRGRTGDQAIEAVKRMDAEGWQATVKEIGQVGMKGIEYADRFSVAIAWKGLYDKALSEGKGDTEAVEYADKIILDTQPSTDARDIAPIFRDKNAWKQIVLQFTQSLNTVYQNIRYDVPEAVRQGEYGRAVGIVSGYMVAGLLLGAFAQMRGQDDPEEGEDWKYLLFYATTQFSDSIPVIGSDITALTKRLVTGDRQFYSDDNMPAVSAVLGGVEAMTSGDLAKAAGKLYEGVGLTLGLPTLAIKDVFSLFGGEDK